MSPNLQSPEISVLIIGAGPTGLALACDLARRGVDFRIIDKSPAYFVGSRGKGLQPRSLEVMDDFGVVDRILSCGRFHLPFRGYDGAKVLGDLDPHEGRHPTPDVPYASVLIIPQWRVEETLRNLMEKSGARVESGSELVAIEQDAAGVAATIQRGDGRESVRARYLVGCDGGHSFVRKSLDIGFEGETWKDERMLVGDVRCDVLDRDHWHAWSQHKDGWVTLCPLPSTDSFQFQGQLPPDVEIEPSLAAFQKIVDERTGRSDIKLHDATWLSLYRANVRMVDRFHVGRGFVAGDAAHVHSPAGGQGMNTGIQDAYNLGWKLAAVLNGASTSLLDSYDEERLPVAAALLGVTSRLHRQVFASDFSAFRRGPETLQLGLNYRDCSLSVEAQPPSSPLRAGDRAPDAPLLDNQKRSARLFDLLRGPHFTLLSLWRHDELNLHQLAESHGKILHVHAINANDSPVPASISCFTDHQGHFRNAYGADPAGLLLLRPDGYIGFFGGPGAFSELSAHLHRFLPAA